MAIGSKNKIPNVTASEGNEGWLLHAHQLPLVDVGFL